MNSKRLAQVSFELRKSIDLHEHTTSNLTELTYGESLTLASIHKLNKYVNTCEDCLFGKNPAVINKCPGLGNPFANKMIIGEAPGFDENETGIPFVGLAGSLLRMISLEVTGSHKIYEGAWLTNVLKCRPQNNRTPSLDETITCKRFLTREIEIVKPKKILILGAVALQCMLEDPSLKIGKHIDTIQDYFYRVNKEKYTCSIAFNWHPAYIIRQTGNKLIETIDGLKEKLSWLYS